MSGYSSQISRVTRTRAQASSAYNRMSRWYDLLAGANEKRITEMGLLLLNVQQGDRVLEIGFGTGEAILNIARKVGNYGTAYGIDISTGMLSIAQTKVNSANLSQRVKLQVGDATRLPYTDSTFDSIFMSFTLELFDTPEIPVVLNECRRVLKKDGHICIVTMSKKGKGVALSLYEFAHRICPEYVDCRPIFLAEALEDSGFKIIESKIVRMWGLPVEIALVNHSLFS